MIAGGWLPIHPTIPSKMRSGKVNRRDRIAEDDHDVLAFEAIVEHRDRRHIRVGDSKVVSILDRRTGIEIAEEGKKTPNQWS